MGKPQKKRGLADKVRKTKTSNEIKNNPFEVKINRKKFDILGRKTKHDVGLPGVSRSKAIKKRQETLLKEYKQKSKSNKFVDRRFGEYDTKMAPEDKILKRFALERQRMQDKKNIYNLNEEEELTHFGQSLSEIEKLNDVVDSDSESEDKGLLSAEFTESHFGGGGGLLKKKNAEEEGDEGDGKPRSRQELIEELIIKSKQEKHERQTQKEEARVLTEKLDQDWKSIQSLMARNAPKSVCRVEESKPKAEEYDIMVRELGFEMKAQPSEKMKTPEEVAREERDRLQKLEADRQRRMLGDIEEETSKKQSYLSADDLNDGFILDKEDRQMLSYQDGKWNIEDENQNADDEDDDDDDGGDGGDDDDDQHGESGSEEEGSEAESGHSDLDSEKDVVEDDDAEVPRKAENQATPHSTLSKEERLAEQEQAKAENQATPHSTLSKEERLAEQEQAKAENQATPHSTLSKEERLAEREQAKAENQATPHSTLSKEERLAEREQAKAENQATPHSTLSKEERLAEREQAKAELPYTFPAPESFSDLRSLLDGYSADEQCVILERIQKCNHPSLAAGNKLKLQKMFGFLLEYVGDLATRCPPDLGTVNKLVPHLYGLCQLFPNAAYLAMQNVLSDSAHDMEDILEVKGRATLPGLGTLIYLKIVAVLFPTSDFRHPVTTPALVYISQLLTKCPITSLEEVTGGLILCCLTMEYVTLSQRFVPELVSYLLGILHLAVRDKSSLGYCVVPPFKLTGRHCDLLVTSDAAHAESWSQMPLPLSGAQSLKLKDNLERDHYKLSCLATCLDLVKRCTSMYKSLPSFTQIFCPIRILLSKHISVEGHSSGLQDLHREALEAVSTSPERPSPLVFEKTKPIPLRLFTPKIVEVLDFGKKRGSSKQEREREKLKHKYRKELKGALREMRKDTKFLAREKLTEIMNRDAERKRKVKELFGSLSTQEGEWKALKKKKRK